MMNEIFSNPIVWSNQNSGFLLVVLTAFYCVATIAIVIVTRGANKLSEKHLEQALKVEVASKRPYLSLKLEVVLKGPKDGLPFAYLFLQNTGNTQALHVRATLDPKPSTIANIGGEKKRRIAYFLEHELFSIAPGESVNDAIGFTPSLFEDFKPAVFKGTIEYQDVLGNQYQEPAEVNFEILREAVPQHSMEA